MMSYSMYNMWSGERLKKAMEANGVSKEELTEVISSLFFRHQMQLREAEKITSSLLGDLTYTKPYQMPIDWLIILALLCNVSTDYLLGLSSVMNPAGN